MCQNERFQFVEIYQNEIFQQVEIYQTADISTNTEMSIDCSVCSSFISVPKTNSVRNNSSGERREELRKIFPDILDVKTLMFKRKFVEESIICIIQREYKKPIVKKRRMRDLMQLKKTNPIHYYLPISFQ